MEFIEVCKQCTESICCSKPFFAFVTETERIKILDFLKSENINIAPNKVFLYNQENNSYVIPKEQNGKCIFLQKDKTCAIHSVKPLDCQLWPLTFEFNPQSNEITLILGECSAVKLLKVQKKLKQWLNQQKELLLKNLNSYTRIELIAYSNLPDISQYQILHQKILVPNYS